MPNVTYIGWLKDMLAYYPSARAKLRFDHRAGVEELLGLITGVPLMRRKTIQMEDSQVLSLVLNSFALLRGNVRMRREYFYMGLDEITLRDDRLAAVLCSVPSDGQQNSMEVLAAMVAPRNQEPLRSAEIEAALGGDQASALTQGAL
jgi:hypothetical protein